MKFKKMMLVFMASLMVMSLTALSVSADDEITDNEVAAESEEAAEDSYITSEDGTYKYSVNTDEDDNEEYVALEEYLGSDESIVIPEEIDGIKVQALGDFTYYEKTFIKDITVSENIEDFGEFSFYGCTSLMEFKVNERNEIYTADKDGVLMGKDGMGLFAYPVGKNPEEIVVPEEVVGINSSAFAVCKNLKKITLPKNLEYLGMFAFSECESLDNVVIPDKITSIERFTFSGCTSLSNITLPDTLETLGDAAFFNCSSLMDFKFPTSLYSVGQGAFVSVGFKEIAIPGSVTEINYYAFGFTTDQSDQIIPEDNYVITGYAGSYAQTYCTENGIEFVEYVPDTVDDKENSGLKPGIIVAICIGGGIIVILAIVIIVKTVRKNKDSDDDEDNDDSDNEDDNEKSVETQEEPENDDNTENEGDGE